jgi:hypothetical protein
MNEIKASLPVEIIEILSKHLLNLSKKEIHDYFDKTTQDEFIYLKINKLKHFDNLLNAKLGAIKNIGIDFPLYFENKDKPNLVIVAMDPKRKDNNQIVEESISLSSVFALNNLSSRSTNKNDYWKFISPLTKDFNVYLTDVYKIYFDNANPSQKISSKDSKFKNFEILIENQKKNLHYQILEEEIETFFSKSKPNQNFVIALGNEAKDAICRIYNITTKDKISVEQKNKKFIFMPHISRIVTQNIKTISNLFEAMSIIKDLRKNDKSATEYKNLGIKIKELNKTLFS